MTLPATTTNSFRVSEWTDRLALPLINSEFDMPKKLKVMLHITTDSMNTYILSFGLFRLKSLKCSIYVITVTSTIPPTLKCFRKNGTSRT